MGKTLGIFGAGGHAKVVIDTVRRGSDYRVGSMYDDASERHGLPFYRETMIVGGLDRLLHDLAQGTIDIAFVAVGHNDTRARIGEHILRAGHRLATIIDPSAIISPTTTLGIGTLVVAGAIINADTRIGDNVIVNTAASIDHDCVIKDGVHIAPHATLCGGVTVGERSLIGAGATLIPGVAFPGESTLGAGSTLTRLAEEKGTWVGAPAKVLLHT